MIEQTRELRRVVGSLAPMRDEDGVLSITVGIDPGEASGGTPSWQIVLDNALAELRHDSVLGHVLKRRLDEASARLADLTDPTTPGRGRALYVALESGAASDVALQVELPTGARVGPAAHVLPLLGALDEGERAGLVSTSRDVAAVSELELGKVRHLDPIELEPWVGDWWPEMKGPARANPQRGQQVVSQRDRYERRLATAYRHSLDEAASTIAALAGEREWTRAALAGDPRRIGVLDTVLQGRGVATTTIEANLEGLRAEQAVRRLEGALQALVAGQRARLAEEVVSAGNGVSGLVSVLAALAEARVDHLLIDTNGTFPGVVGPGETMVAAEPGEDATDLTDLIVARALATDAAVTPLHGDAAAALEASGGIAALLRW